MNPLHLSPHHPIRKALGTLIVTILAAGIALVLRHGPGVSEIGRRADYFLYDTAWKTRPARDMRNADVAVVAFDDRDLRKMEDFYDYGYPWPRQFWGQLAKYLEAAGARAVIFDLQFAQKSSYQGTWDDDEEFAAAINAMRIPVVFAAKIRTDAGASGTEESIEKLAPPFSNPRRGVVTVEQGTTLREYKPGGAGELSPARAVLRALNLREPEWASEKFLLHYYGPFDQGDHQTFLYVSASNHVHAALEWMKAGAGRAPTPADPTTQAQLEQLKGRIVLVGSLSAASFDLFTTPLSKQYPGVDMHATAIENLLRNQRVETAPMWVSLLVAVVAALGAASATIFPALIVNRLAGGLAALVALLLGAGLAFNAPTAIWLPLAAPLTAGALGTFGGLARNYITEDARRRFMTKALGQYVSPEITRVLESRPESLKLEAELRTMTALFSDMAGFTDFSEAADVRVLTRVLNLYMERMSSIVLEQAGTIDKYIGDAIMAFWNAPIDQADHAARACRAALRMRAAEADIRRELLADGDLVALLDQAPAVKASVESMGVGKLYTRFGINTGLMAVGNWGSARKFQYTVIGDAVNAAARLEPSNKRYGTRILVAESTIDMVRGQFVVRRVDILRVKGKSQPMGVYELIAEGQGSEAQRRLAAMYEEAFDHYRARRWAECESLLLAIGREFDDDGPSAMLAARVAHLKDDPPPPEWDGVFTATDK